MRFAIIAPPTPTQKWKENFEKIAPHISLVIGSKTKYPEEVLCAMVWNQPKGSLTEFKNLKLIFAMGAGVDHIMKDETIPDHIPICRVVCKIIRSPYVVVIAPSFTTVSKCSNF